MAPSAPRLRSQTSVFTVFGEGHPRLVQAEWSIFSISIVKRICFDNFYFIFLSGASLSPWVPSGCLLGASQVPLGVSWVPSGCLWVPSVCLWVLLGGSWVTPGCLWVPPGCLDSWAHVGFVRLALLMRGVLGCIGFIPNTRGRGFVRVRLRVRFVSPKVLA